MSESSVGPAVLDQPTPNTKIENLPTGHSPIAELGKAYLSQLLAGREGKIADIQPLSLVTAHNILLYGPLNTEWGEFDDPEFVTVSLDDQLDYVNQVRALLGDQATFSLNTIDLSHDEENIEWLTQISHGYWPISTDIALKFHDRSNHHDALIYSPPEQSILVTTAADYAKQARIASKDIVVPAVYAGSKRGKTHENNFIGHLDRTTEGLGGLSSQTAELLAPLMDESTRFEEAIKTHRAIWVQKIENYLWRGQVLQEGIGAALGMALMSLETITLATQSRDASPDEIRVALYNVIKGYIKTAAKLRGEEIPEELLDFWPTDEQGIPNKMTNEDLINSLSKKNG